MDPGSSKHTSKYNGWPSFLSVFFSFIKSNNFLDYVNLQRMLTTVISTLTIIPMYFLAKKFMQKSFAIICSAAFIFSPRLIENSLLGLTEPLFLLLGIVFYFGLILIYTFNALVLSALVYFLMIPISSVHYLKIRKKYNFQDENNEDEDIL